MDEHLVVNVDQLPKPEAVGLTGIKPELAGASSSSTAHPKDGEVAVEVDDDEDEEADEHSVLLGMGECRICQEEDSINNLESPCACCGSLQYAHRKCVQYWCNEKGDITCEICHKPYQPGYTAPPRPPPSDETTIDIGGVWQISGAPLDIHDPRLLALAEAERQLFEADYDDYNGNSGSTAFCRSTALILMALLLMRHALSITGDRGGDAEEDDASTFFSLFLLRAVGFLLPCYIMIWAISILQRRRQRQGFNRKLSVGRRRLRSRNQHVSTSRWIQTGRANGRSKEAPILSITGKLRDPCEDHTRSSNHVDGKKKLFLTFTSFLRRSPPSVY